VRKIFSAPLPSFSPGWLAGRMMGRKEGKMEKMDFQSISNFLVQRLRRKGLLPLSAELVFSISGISA
jgi:hypothetical protein